MSTPLDDHAKEEGTPWTMISDQAAKKNITAPKSSEQVTSQEWKKLKILPYVFTALTFLLIFIFNSQFKNLSADLFSSSGGKDVRFGLPVTSNPLWEEETDTLEPLEEKKQKSETGSVAQSQEKMPSVVEEKNAPEETPVAQKVLVEPVQDNSNLLPENLHKAAPVQVVPVSTQSVKNNSTFRTNTHTYDKVAQLQIAEDLKPLQLESLHTAAPVAQISKKPKIPKPKQNVQSGPEENAVVLISFLLSSLAWFGMRKLRT